ncbi:peroxiredoxin [Candidatus Marsarchaeota archaeon]|nr:peroxiredoxin [Candidatus Marsarchaeota archaeon]MCL5404518.1 peroxiredoxin [Candidatus Marsarchaeota archaeon]
MDQIPIEERFEEIEASAYFPKDDKIEKVKIPEKGKWNILTFYPGDFTFVCATDIEAFMGLYDEFKKNDAEVFAISTDSVFSHKGWAQTSPRVQKSIIPMIEDFNKSITKRFGLLNAQSGQAMRSVVIIDPEGTIQYMAAFNNNLGKDAEHVLNAFLGLKYLRDHPAKEGHMCAIPANWKKGERALDIDVVKDIGKL